MRKLLGHLPTDGRQMSETMGNGALNVKAFVPPILAFGACFAAAGIGMIAVNQTLQSWYLELRKPAWNPPNWVFGPVWTLLYAAMAISAWLVWKNRAANPEAARAALGWFVAQLVLNTAWAFAEIVVLWIAIVCTILTSWRVNQLAAILLVPYLAWVTFASSLNGTIWLLNA
jgi:benzodiazapine receptor